ncbi:hypothetical protein N7457_006225 [Penicillium paradoxum]|uniref:uncharacterized protein n=1 Tax=Penicillium paradoxum TaxID=176176 RepID=UPI0025470BAC|nr:uncharacterized protein N7457_006225 [Penicillium paradoxum]KAJ5781065.1 hypothetical protein N7457_006225 [Penicillium paradoxum]
MRQLSLLLCALPAVSSALITTLNPTAPIKNANHIFNVIHDSMRQWGSSLHHNGVSFFLAGVPAGTHFYHGTSVSDPVNGTEWLAFEPEHAMVFARPPWGPPPHGSPVDDDARQRNRGHGELRMREDHSGQHSVFNEDENGYLHTYAAAKDLRLLYIDGMSAAKTSKGTLDSQDVVLFNGSFEGEPGWMGREGERAMLACDMADNQWEGRIDGVLRMEAGFEIILCHFERDLVPVRITQAQKREDLASMDRGYGDRDGLRGQDDGMGRRPVGPGVPGRPPQGPGKSPNSARWMRAVTARYNGIGGRRVSLNFNHFVTAFAHDVDLFQDDTGLPRLANLSYEELAPIRAGITDLIMNHHPAEDCEDWQAIADMIVTRYSKELAYFGSGAIDSIEDLQSEIDRLFSPFIDYGDRDDAAEIERCATQFLPSGLETGGLAGRAIYGVANRICSDLLRAGKKADLESAAQVIKKLIGYLDWATWKECRGCAANEICVVPIWPMGTVQDYENPKCKDASDPYGEGGESYWNAPHY